MIGGSKLPGWFGRPRRKRMSPAPSTTVTSGTPSPVKSATTGVLCVTRPTDPGCANRPPPWFSSISTELGDADAMARSDRPLPVKSPVATTCGYISLLSSSAGMTGNRPRPSPWSKETKLEVESATAGGQAGRRQKSSGGDRRGRKGRSQGDRRLGTRNCPCRYPARSTRCPVHRRGARDRQVKDSAACEVPRHDRGGETRQGDSKRDRGAAPQNFPGRC